MPSALRSKPGSRHHGSLDSSGFHNQLYARRWPVINRDLALDDPPAIYVTSRNCAAAASRLHTRPMAKLRRPDGARANHRAPHQPARHSHLLLRALPARRNDPAKAGRENSRPKTRFQYPGLHTQSQCACSTCGASIAADEETLTIKRQR